jgi:hypothetical protein
MPILLEDKGREYRRFSHTPEERQYLQMKGLQPVQSSNISAIGTSNDKLLVRFQNGAMYEYPGSAEFYGPMLRANSKGKFFWLNIRKPDLPFNKASSLIIPGDLDITDEELFADIEFKAKQVEVLFEKDLETIATAGLFVKLFDNVLSETISRIKIL